MKGKRIALTGRRNVGKSTAANILVGNGFLLVHAFEGGKVAAEAWMGYAMKGHGYSDDDIWNMVHGRLKDVLCPHLPGGVAPRFFLEKFGAFMGIQMGVEWTLKMEVERLERLHGPQIDIIADSMIYESPYWRSIGGVIYRLERPEFEGQPVVESDAAQAQVFADETLFCKSPEEVENKIMELVFYA